MRPGSHAAPDGSFGRSAGMQVGRAAILLVVAILIGVVLLHRGRSGPVTISGSATTKPARSTTTSAATAAPTTIPAPLRGPASVKVLVANATAGVITNLAGKLSVVLHAKGYDTLSPVNADTHAAATMIYFQPGYSAEATALAQALGLSPTVIQPMPAHPPVATPALAGQANILVVAGTDVAGVAGATTGGTTGGTTGRTTATTRHTVTTAAHTTSTT